MITKSMGDIMVLYLINTQNTLYCELSRWSEIELNCSFSRKFLITIFKRYIYVIDSHHHFGIK